MCFSSCHCLLLFISSSCLVLTIQGSELISQVPCEIQKMNQVPYSITNSRRQEYPQFHGFTAQIPRRAKCQLQNVGCKAGFRRWRTLLFRFHQIPDSPIADFQFRHAAAALLATPVARSMPAGTATLDRAHSRPCRQNRLKLCGHLVPLFLFFL